MHARSCIWRCRAKVSCILDLRGLLHPRGCASWVIARSNVKRCQAVGHVGGAFRLCEVAENSLHTRCHQATGARRSCSQESADTAHELVGSVVHLLKSLQPALFSQQPAREAAEVLIGATRNMGLPGLQNTLRRASEQMHHPS